MQCTRNGGGFDWRIEVEQCDSSAIVFEEEITREMGGGGLDRVSRAGRANSSAERERESEVCCKRADVATMEKEETISFFWIRGRKRYENGGGGGGSIMFL